MPQMRLAGHRTMDACGLMTSKFALCRLTFTFGAALLILSLSGCDGPKASWTAEARSPDGKMVAQARTIEPSGIGTGDIGTFVDLNWTNGSQKPTTILAFADGSDYPGDEHVEMTWLTPTHLSLTYKGQRTVEFEATTCHGVEITVRSIPQ